MEFNVVIEIGGMLTQLVNNLHDSTKIRAFSVDTSLLFVIKIRLLVFFNIIQNKNCVVPCNLSTDSASRELKTAASRAKYVII